ncbi:MAG: hypothetical protein EHM14_07470 [Methanothrix sp.]|nr:MAG: hypothetical protein EHM14_07470 [Methanothrix sp.]
MKIIYIVAAMFFLMAVTSIFITEASESYQDLLNLTQTNEDTRMDARDLAFFLVTHDFDATPKDGYVMVELNGTIYILTPNKDKPGLADIAIKKS